MGEMRNAYRILVGKHEGKRPLGRPRHRCDYIRIDIWEIGRKGVHLMQLGRNRFQWRAVVSTVMNLRMP